MPSVEQARLAVVAEFPDHYFLENLAVRADGSLLVTAQNRKELWFVPPPADAEPVSPELIRTYEWNTLFVVEWRPDTFLLGVADDYDTRQGRLYRLDLSGWRPGDPLEPTLLLDFPAPAAGLNGGVLIAPDTLLAAGMTDLIWRVDLDDAGGGARASVWLQHDSLRNRPGEKKPEQPGVNGVQYAPEQGFLYLTSTSQQMMLRVRVDPETLSAADAPEFVAGGREWDDFIIDEASGVAYVTTHRENTIDRVRLERDGCRDGRSSVAGAPFNPDLIGPSAAAWSRRPGEHGRVAYVLTDGGTAQPPDGVYRSAKVLRATFPKI